jgi:probable addiction module antidote protein
MADNINTKEEVFACLEGALAEHDMETFFDVMGAIARSKGMAKIAKDLGLNRESLYKSLSRDGNPSFVTIAKIIDLLGCRIEIKQKTA